MLLHGSIGTVLLCFLEYMFLVLACSALPSATPYHKKICQIKMSRHFGDYMFVCRSTVGDCFLMEWLPINIPVTNTDLNFLESN